MPRRIVCASPKGGVGKSVLARNLATSAAHAGMAAAICDLDVQKTSRNWALRRAARPNLPQVALIDDVEDEAGGKRLVGWEDIDLLLGDIGALDLLFIDTPPSIEHLPGEFRTLLQGADLIVVPCGPTFDDAESIAPFIEHLRAEGRPAVLVMNKVRSRVNFGAVKSYLLKAGADLCPVEVGDRADIHRSATQGLAMPDFPGAPGADEIDGVWAAVCQRLGLAVGSSAKVGGPEHVVA
jgi:chromosome partitioning protein